MPQEITMEMQTYNELQTEIARLQKEADKVRKGALKAAIQQIRNLMQEFGLSFEDIEAPKKRGRGKADAKAKPGRGRKAKAVKKGGKVKPKYRSPADPKLTWTGRGRKPQWAAEWVDSGRSLDELLIQ